MTFIIMHHCRVVAHYYSCCCGAKHYGNLCFLYMPVWPTEHPQVTRKSLQNLPTTRLFSINATFETIFLCFKHIVSCNAPDLSWMTSSRLRTNRQESWLPPRLLTRRLRRSWRTTWWRLTFWRHVTIRISSNCWTLFIMRAGSGWVVWW